ITERLPKWEDRGWIGVKIATHVKALVNGIRQRCAPTTIKQATSEQDRNTIRVAETEAVRERTTQFHITQTPSLEMNEQFDLSGAKLSTLKQSTAYKGIREQTHKLSRRTTENNVETIRDRRQTLTGSRPTDAEIWKGTRHKDFRRVTSDFIWKIMHGAIRVGEYWENIPGYEQRATCNVCGTTETVQHILFECQANGQKEIWEHVR
ncbi:uncharacterized protein C8Q71DRAFT_690289, partial [Rhodofomes roseus]